MRNIAPGVAILAFAMLLMLAISGPVAAQGEEADPAGTEITRQQTGGYDISIYVSPDQPRADWAVFTVFPRMADTGEPVESAVVHVYGSPADGGRRQGSPALNTPDDRGRYIGRLNLLSYVGLWAIEAEVDGPAGVASVTAPVEVVPRALARENLPYGTTVWALIIVAFVGGALWLVYSSKRARRKQQAGQHDRQVGHGGA